MKDFSKKKNIQPLLLFSKTHPVILKFNLHKRKFLFGCLACLWLVNIETGVKLAFKKRISKQTKDLLTDVQNFS
jgi:hypothetical protein